ncbi:MAG: type VI secretion system-associated FHA domain protein TagH [Rhodobacteraceae bacterium]|nr:type VI secretion system-associated FHA domain protein TagH [Paracoccaceae bacterium]
MTVTLKFQSSGTIPGDAGPMQMQGGSMTLGRGPANDIVLPDPDRMLSKNHCVVEDHNGNVLVVDLSTNGTFLNYSKIPLGKTPTPLNNGDVLCIGTYELVVEISSDLADIGDMIAAPAAAAQISPGVAGNAPDPMALLDDAGPGGDFLDDLLGAEGGPTGPSQLNPVDPIDDLLPPMGEDEDPFFQKPIDGREGTGASLPMHNPSASDAFSAPSVPPPGANQIPDDWDDLLGGGPVESPQAPAPIPPPAPPLPAEAQHPPIPPDGTKSKRPPVLPRDDSPEEPEAVPSPATHTPAAALAEVADSGSNDSSPNDSGPSDAARAFLKALGTENTGIEDKDLGKTMARMGRVMRTLITGLREILMTRTSIKSEFRIEQTMISAGGNNPLKFSISADQAIEAMVRPATKGYLSPETAAEQALDDIKAHEIAMITGMEAALKGVLAKLDPAILAGKIETSNAFGSLFKGKKARYWEVYEKIYAEISDQAENDFHELFSREFARAYKGQLEKLKE